MSQYSNLPAEEIEELLSNYLIDHWSVSSVKCFIRNEKAFEKEYIFKEKDRLIGLSAIIGTCYHKALMEYWRAFQRGETMGFDRLVTYAHDELEKIGADKYRPRAKKTVDETKVEALTRLNFLITNFLAEVDSYTDEIQEILFVEEMVYEFITLDGIDIPVPLKMIPDIVFINKKGELCILDHKAKSSYTEPEAVHLYCSQQAIGYVCGMKEKVKRPDMDELIAKWPKIKDGVRYFYYYENKYSKNKDNSRQIKRIDIKVDETSKVYEAILFEGVYRMLRAVQDPDYVYVINPDDHYVDAGEMFDFWVKTRIEGLDGFPNLTPKQKEILKHRKKDLRSSAISKIPRALITAFKNQAGFVSFNLEEMSNLSIQERIEHRLKCFNLMVKVAHTIEGFSCDTYLLEVGAGVKIASIAGYKMDLANAMGVADVRVSKNLIQYEGGSYLALEVNKKDRVPLIITAKELRKDGLKLPIGVDNYRNPVFWDIGNPSTPHLLVSGASGSGKSVAIKTLIESALAKGLPVSILDPKFEFIEMKKRKGVTVFNEHKDIEAFMERKVAEMDQMYKEGITGKKQLIVFDEASDCFTRQTKERKFEKILGLNKDYDEAMAHHLTSIGQKYDIPQYRTKMEKDQTFKTLEENTLLIAQKARSAGIHLVLASQRFSVQVLTGDAKANFPSRLCLTVASGTDSKVMLDEEGAEKLNGRGDALYRSPEMGAPLRIQTYLFK